MADVFINALPEDYVPYWDLDLSGEEIVRDASAAAIASSGMFILAEQTNSKIDYKKYLNYANSIAESLIENYTFLNSKREHEEGLLIQIVFIIIIKTGELMNHILQEIIISQKY